MAGLAGNVPRPTVSGAGRDSWGLLPGGGSADGIAMAWGVHALALGLVVADALQLAECFVNILCIVVAIT
jgi:hypothetical protein